MATITQRISHFRGINRSAQQNGLDVSYAYNAENVDIAGGKVSSKVGSYRLVSPVNVPPAKPIPYFTNAVDYMILRKKFIKLTDLSTPWGEEFGGYEPNGLHDLQDVVCDWDVEDVESPNYHETTLLIRGVGRAALRARINNIDTVICSGMLDTFGSPAKTRKEVDEYNIDDYWYYRDLYVDGSTGKTCVYYLDSSDDKIHCRQFGSGTTVMANKTFSAVGSNSDGQITSITTYTQASTFTDKMRDRALLDGIFLFHESIGGTLDEDDLDKAFMWLKVTSITTSASGNVVFNVETTRLASELTVTESGGTQGDRIVIRGECSDVVVTWMEMYYGRLFAAAHRANVKHPRRLYWSCLPGDGRTIEDWTQSEYSIDTSGGHVDVGDPFDGYITGLIVCDTQLLIFTQTRLWRLYGTSPSNYRLELVGNLEGTRISNPVEVNGTVYWLSRSGITYYNGSYVALMDDNCSTRRLLESLPECMQNSMYFSSVHACLFDGNIMFAIDATTHYKAGRVVQDDEYDECYIIRYNLETGDVIKYVVPADRYRQQFTDVLSKNFGVVNGKKVAYETRYFQSLVHKPKTVWNPTSESWEEEIPPQMTMTQWKPFGTQEHGWYDNKPVYSAWESDWNDLRTPETVKKVHTAIMRGSGEFDLTIESETNKDEIHVVMPETRAKVKELTPHYAEGRSMKFVISSDREFEIEPYMTMIFEAGNKR